ncbi:MAG: FMN-binding protein [Spirochaetia bacterium]
MNRSVPVALVCAAALTILIVLSGCVSREARETRNLRIEDIDVMKIPDGTYVGKYGYDELVYTAKLEVEDGRIEWIRIEENKPSPRSDWAEEIPKRVIEANSTQVDVVSGATAGSKAVLKAIELALKAGARLR